jgi:hypothetical protein
LQHVASLGLTLAQAIVNSVSQNAKIFSAQHHKLTIS